MRGSQEITNDKVVTKLVIKYWNRRVRYVYVGSWIMVMP